jgi:prepilin-type processing-associated H-X9-DG protein
MREDIPENKEMANQQSNSAQHLDHQKPKMNKWLKILLIIGISLLVLVIGLAAIIIPAIYRTPVIAVRMVCGSNLASLGKAIQMYSDKFDGNYPAADSWCDLILQHGDVPERYFNCKGALVKGDKNPYNYAINPKARKTSPPDTVLIFDSKGGKNQFGGPELLAPQNHIGEGCNILFNDGHVKFTTPEEFSELKW